ncbi:MAG: AEC family transporter [Planctomycetota bacterium]
MPTWMRVVESLLPLVVLVSLGAALVRWGFLEAAARKQLDRLVYWVCLPALLIGKIGIAGGLDAAVGQVAAALGIATLVAAGAGVLGWRVLRGRNNAFGVMVQGGCRGNLAFVGLPVVALGGGSPRAVAIAAVALAPTVLMYNLISVSALSWGRSRGSGLGGGALVRGVGRELITNPILIACALGLLLAASGWRPPEVAQTTLSLIGQPAGPLALMSLGGALVVYRVRGQLVPAAWAGMTKLVVCPAMAGALAWWWGFDADQALAAMALAAAPSAVVGYVLVAQLDGDEGLAASIIALTTIASVVSIGVVLGVVAVWPR